VLLTELVFIWNFNITYIMCGMVNLVSFLAYLDSCFISRGFAFKPIPITDLHYRVYVLSEAFIDMSCQFYLRFLSYFSEKKVNLDISNTAKFFLLKN